MKQTDWMTEAAIEIADLLGRDDYITSIRVILQRHAPVEPVEPPAPVFRVTEGGE